MMITRERALNALANYDDDATVALCTRVFETAGIHAKLQAASIRCLASADLATDTTLRNKILAAVRDDDPRVGLAAVATLSDVPSARSGLKAAADDPSVTGPVAAKLNEMNAD